MDWFVTHFAVILGILFAIVSCLLLLQQRRTPQSMVAWLLFVFLVPYLALPVFLFLGSRKRGPRFRSIAFTEIETSAGAPGSLAQTFRSMHLPPASGKNSLKLHRDGPSAWAAMLDVVSTAKTDLDVAFYRIGNDTVGLQFVEALTQKVVEGVHVRLIIDPVGGFWRPRRALKKFERAGGQLHHFLPLFSRRETGHLNLRNHRKMIIADRQRVYAGGRNVSLKYLGADANTHHCCDLCFTLIGPSVRTYADVFQSDWGMPLPHNKARSTAGKIAANSQAVVQVVPSGPDLPHDPLHDGLVQAIHAAQKRVWIATPYFLPTQYLEHALKTATQRGVDVRIVIPSKSNQRIADIARGGFLRPLASAGAKIFLYGPSMMHAKAGLIDDAAWIGSANFDVRSMLLNFETVLFLYDQVSVHEVSDWFQAVQTQCRSGIGKAHIARRLLEGLFRMGAPIL